MGKLDIAEVLYFEKVIALNMIPKQNVVLNHCMNLFIS